MGYTKIIRSLLGSSVWITEPPCIRLVWIAMVLRADEHGVVDCSLPAIAGWAHVPIGDALIAVDYLSHPDPRTNEAPLIVAMEGVGWSIPKILESDDRITPQVRILDPLARRQSANERVVTYVIGPCDRPVIKIGRTTNLRQRIDTLQTASPSDLDVIAVIDGDHEQRLHETLARWRTRPNGEWFRYDDESRAALRAAGIPVPGGDR